MASAVTVEPTPNRSQACIGHITVVLGAGFSIAVNPAFPDTDRLGEMIRARLPSDYSRRLPTETFKDGRFEEWLSYLAERQPHHDQAWALEAGALELRIVEAMRVVLSEVQRNALSAPAPQWLYALLSLLHAYRASVISLNYDNLIECGVETMRMTAPGRPDRTFVEEEDILDGLPKSAVPPSVQETASPHDFLGHPILLDSGLAESFRLLKLHGSLSWYWLPGDGTGSSLRRWRLPGTFGQLWDEDYKRRLRELPRHDVFIVPPSVLKGERLRESVARELWRRAAVAIWSAERLVLIGYSVPLADHSISGMLSEGLEGRTVQIEIVNPAPSEVRKRLVRLGVAANNIEVFGGRNCVERWVRREVKRASLAAVESLRVETLHGEETMYVSYPTVDAVTSVSRRGSTVTLRLRLARPGDVAVQPARSKALLDRLDGARKVVIEIGSRKLPVVGHWLNPQVMGHAGLDQLHFVAAGR
jgi:hypothetical protein